MQHYLRCADWEWEDLLTEMNDEQTWCFGLVKRSERRFVRVRVSFERWVMVQGGFVSLQL